MGRRSRPRDLMTYAFFFLCPFIARPNSTKLSGGLNQRLCCVDLSPTALRKLRRYVMDPGLSTPEHRHYLEAVLYNRGPEGNRVKESSGQSTTLRLVSSSLDVSLPTPPPRSSGISPLLFFLDWLTCCGV